MPGAGLAAPGLGVVGRRDRGVEAELGMICSEDGAGDM